jgi:hypothetical protein
MAALPNAAATAMIAILFNTGLIMVAAFLFEMISAISPAQVLVPPGRSMSPINIYLPSGTLFAGSCGGLLLLAGFANGRTPLTWRD